MLSDIASISRQRHIIALGNGFLFALTALAGVSIAPSDVEALPLYARQTGQPCATCHTIFPELTPYGRRFKLLGYTAGGTRCHDEGDRVKGWLTGPDSSDADLKSMKDYLAGKSADSPDTATYDPRGIPPISVMVIPSFTHTAVDQTPSLGVKANDNWQMQTISLFAGGQIYCDFGAFVQVTHDPNAALGNPDGYYSPFFLDNTDLRYARQTKLFGLNAIIGVSVNNNPTVQDVWNTTPAWGFPQQASEIAPSPTASTMIEGAWGGTVVGTTGYMLLDDSIYAEFGFYQSMGNFMLANLGQDPVGDRIAGLAPYWRFAYERNWGEHSLMAGVFGMMADIYPGNDHSQGTDRITDWGFDTQYQYIGDVHALTAKATYITEKQQRDASAALMLADNNVNYLHTFKATATYQYEIPQLTGSRIAFSAGYFSVGGSVDATQYGTFTGSPNSAGYIGEIAFSPFSRGNIPAWPWLNSRIGLQYTAYTKFDGSTSAAFDNNGRKPSDNNTFYSYIWTAF